LTLRKNRSPIAFRLVAYAASSTLACFVFASLICAALVLSGCSRSGGGRYQGYVEGEFVYVSSPSSGQLVSLPVSKGMAVKEGDPLFELDRDPEKEKRDESVQRLAQARATLEDALKGKRPSELDAAQAMIRQEQAALVLAEKEFARQERLARAGASSAQDLDKARSAYQQHSQRLAELTADLKTARLGLRSDQISAAEANVKAMEAALNKADWDLSQKRRTAPKAGLVFDTLYREGEWVPAGRPVVALLPPENIKVRAFVPEQKVQTIHPGDRVRVFIDGISPPAAGTVSFISPRAEYTPPVIYSKESRGKLVFMIEAVFDRETASKLHPGQPVDVQFGL
jgi:HlyD family secretion protein